MFSNFCGDYITKPLNTKEDIKEYIIEEPLRVLAFAVALELLPGQVWAAEGLGR